MYKLKATFYHEQEHLLKYLKQTLVSEGSHFYTHKTFMLFSSFSRIFIFWDIGTGAESYRRWLASALIGGEGRPTSSFNSTAAFLNFTVSECDSSDDAVDVFTEMRVECNGRPMSWNEFMLEKPLSSSVWWHVENLFLRTLTGMLADLLATTLGGKTDGSNSSSLFEFDELEDEWTDDSSVLRSDKCDSRSKPNKKSFRCWSNVVRGKLFGSDALLACDKIGSCVLRKFCTVLESLNASLESFSASMPTSFEGLVRVSNTDTAASSSQWKLNFSGLTSTPVEDLFLEVRRLKKLFRIYFHNFWLSLINYQVKSLKAL